MGHKVQQLLSICLVVSVLCNSVTSKPFDIFDWFGDDEPEDNGAEASASAAETKSGSVSLEGPLGSISANGAIGGAGSVSVGDESGQRGQQRGHPDNFMNDPNRGAFAGAGAGPQGSEGIAGADGGQQFQQRPMEGRPSQRLYNRGPPQKYAQQPPPGYGHGSPSSYGYRHPNSRNGAPPTIQRPQHAPPPPPPHHGNNERPYQGRPPQNYQSNQPHPSQQKPGYSQQPPQGYRPPQGYY